MCGIVGYIGEKNVESVILVGLEKLEYRGYDSAGIAVLENEDIFIQKKKGRIKDLVLSLNGISFYSGIGIGHTRWATHGEPTDRNAHPHTDCKKFFAVVHNGIIENFQNIKRKLEKKGHKFISETDTEVIPHLLEEYYNENFLQTVIRVVKLLKGSFALGIISKRHPDCIIGVRMGSPLIIGAGKKENLLCSDIPALLSHTREIIPLKDGEIAVLKKENIMLFDFSGKRKRRRITKIEWDEDMVEKGGFPHYMLKEIHEQPKVIEENLQRILKKSNIEFPNSDAIDILANSSHIIFQSAGTSYHASLYAKYLFEKYIKVFVDCDISSEFRYRDPHFSKNSSLIVISQSGETADTLAGLRLAKSKKLPVISFVNVRGSTIDRESDQTIYLNAGPEIGVASTKAYIAQLFYLLVLTLTLSERKKTIKKEDKKTILKELEKIPDKIRFILGREEEISEIAKKYYNFNNAIFLGRGLLFPTALEGALKLKEISYIHATGYAAGEMKHGPIALIDKNWPVIAIIPKNALYEKMLSNIMEVRARKAQIISVATYGDKEIRNISDDVIYIPKTNPLLEPLVAIIPLQLLAYHIAILRGCDVDKPRNLAKSVTVE